MLLRLRRPSSTASLFQVNWTGALGRGQHASLVVTLMLLTLLLAGCGTLGGGNGGTGAPAPQSSGGDGTTHLLLIGSTALLPLAARAGVLFHQRHPDMQVDVEGGGSVTGLKAVASHKADIGDSDIYADPVLYPDPNLTDHIVSVVAFTLIVDPQVGITSLTTQQILAIFTGKITNWKAVGGANLSIAPIIRPRTSGTRAIFQKYVLAGAEESGHALTSDSSTTVLNAVAHTSGAIGYAPTYLVNATVRAIGINGVLASAQNIKAGAYTFWGYEHMYTLENEVSATTAFLDFMQTPEIQQLARHLGYISVSVVSGTA